MMCCEPHGSGLKAVGVCKECGSEVDENGDALEICGYSPHKYACPVCGDNPCTGYC